MFLFIFSLAVTLGFTTFSGAGSAEVNVSDELSGDISGAGDVSYRGNPSVNVDTSGIGSVSQD